MYNFLFCLFRVECKSKNDSIELSDVSVNSPEKFQSVDCLELASEIIVKKVSMGSVLFIDKLVFLGTFLL